MKLITFICLTALSFSLNVCTVFDSLERAASYAGHTNEHPEIDNLDWEHPDFTTFYTSQKSSLISRIKSFFGLHQEQLDVASFEQTLQEVTRNRVDRGLTGEFVQKIVLGNQGRVVVFGDLQGAFHSLVRSLEYLVTQNILSENLVLQEDVFFVFNGNVIDAAAYNLESLMLVLALMQKNPERVIYISGKNEHAADKDKLTLYRQLENMTNPAQAERIWSHVTAFFDTLPRVLYVLRDTVGALKIFSQYSKEFDDDRLGSFLSLDSKTNILYANNQEKKPSQVPIGAVIRAHDFSRTQGLKRYVGPPTTWSVFSSPTGSHRRLYGFFRDAFAIIDSTVHFHDWIISLYIQDLQKKSGFEMVGTYNLSKGVFIAGHQIDFYDSAEVEKFEKIIKEKQTLFEELKSACKGQKEAKSVQVIKSRAQDMRDQLLKVGTSLDLSKSSKLLGLKIKDTLTKAFAGKNKQGGVRGVTFQNIILDDAYTPEIARKNYLKFVNELGVDIILASYGTATIQESLDLLKDNKMILLFPAITESRPFRQADLKNIVCLSVSYYDQGKALVNYLLQKSQPKKVALFYQNDDFGRDGLEGAKDAFRAHKFTDIIEIPYDRNQVDFSSQVKLIEQGLPDAIGFFSIPLAAMEFMKALGVKFLSSKTLFGISDLRDDDLLTFLNEKGLTLIYANSLPNWKSKTLKFAQEYKQFAETNGITLDPFSFETYVISEIFFYLIDEVEGTVTKEKIIQAAEKIKNLDFKGLKLNFDPDTRVLLNDVWIAQNDDEPWVKVAIKEVTEQKLESTVSQGAQEQVKQKEESGVLTLGTSLDLSKSLKKAHEVIKETLTKVFEEKNRTGGVHGLLVRDVFLDDGYVPELARQNYMKFLNEMSVDIIFGSRGTPTTEKLLDFVKDGRMVLLFPIGTEAGVFRTALLKNILNLTVSFYEQAKALVNNIFQTSNPKKIALFYQDDSFGKDALEGAKKALSKLNITDIIEIPYARGQVDLSPQAAIIQKERPDAIGLFSTPLPAIELIKSVGAAQLAGKIFFGPSVLREQDFLKFMQEKGLPFIYANALPNLNSDDLLIAREYREFAAQNNLNPDSFGFEAYVVANLLLYLIEHIDGPVTKEKILQVGEKIQNLDFKGLLLNFNPETRVLLNTVWLAKNNNEPWVAVELEKPKILKEEPVTEVKKDDVHRVTAKEEKPVMALHGNELLIGNTSDSSKGLKPMTDAIRQGMELATHEINEQGGINNVFIKINYLDDDYTPDLARKNVETFLNDYKTDLLLGTVGTATLEGYIDMVKDGMVAVFFPFSGSSTFREASIKNIIHYAPSYNQTTGAATSYILEKFKPKKWALLYQNDIFGTVLKSAMRELLEQNEIKEILEVPYDRNDANFKEQVKDIAAFNPDVIGFYGPSVSAQAFIRVSDVRDLSGKILYGLSWLSGDKLQSLLKEKGLKMIIPSVLPNPKTSDIPLAKKFRKLAERANIPLDVNAFEGYLDVVLFAHLLRQVKSPITVEKIMDVAQRMQQVDFEGLNLNFDPKTRVLSHEVWLDPGDEHEWVHIDLNMSDKKAKAGSSSEQPISPAEVASPKQGVTAPLKLLHGNELLIGNTSDSSKGLKSMTDAIRQGMELAAQEINERGGINNVLIKINYLDDEYTPELARKNVETFLKDYNTNIFIGSVGTPTLESYINLVEEGKIAVFFPFTGSSTFRKSELKNILNFGPSYDATTGAATNYILNTYASKRWALFYQNDNFGIVPKNAIKKLLEQRNIKDILEVSFERNDVNFTRQVKAIVDFKPEVIGFFGPSVSAQGFIRVAGVKNLSDKILYGLPWLAGEKLQIFLAEKGLKMIIPNVLPNPKTSELPIVKEFRHAIKGTGVSWDVNALEGYVDVKLFAHLLKQVEGTITIEKIMHVAEGMKDVDFGGLKLNFDPNLRQLSHFTWLDLLGIEQEWLLIDLKDESAN